MGLLVERAHGALHPGAAGHDVSRGAAVELAHRDDGGLEGAHVAAHDGLQALHDGSSREHGVRALVGHGAVGAAPRDVDAPPVRGGHARARLHGHLAGRHVAPDVRAIHAVHAFEHARLDHRLGAVAALLGRLEHETHLAAQLVGEAREQARGAKQHGDVAVVAAGVHAALVERAERLAGLLGDGKRVDVGAQHEAAARSAVLKVGVRRAPAQRGDDAGGGGTFVGNAQGVQVRADLGGGVVLLVGDLGVGVVPAPAVDDVVARLACRRTNRVRRLCHVAAPSLASSNLSQGSTPAVAVVPGPTATVADARGAHGETVW